MIFLTKLSLGKETEIGLHVQHIVYIEDCGEELHTFIHTTSGYQIRVVQPYEDVLELIEAVTINKT